MTTTWKATVRWLCLFALSTILVACRSDGDGSDGVFSRALSRIQRGERENQPPVISGTPRSKIVTGDRFEFRPSVSDPDGG